MVLYNKDQFPAHYRNGVFIAFHGSWDRAPYPQGGYNVILQPLDGDHASSECEIFADGFAGAVKSPDQAEHRPSGLAWDQMVHSMFRTMCEDGFIELCIAEVRSSIPRM
jgi:glucose/arabinose dehydrogenase